jgi:hypothetical protein
MRIQRFARLTPLALVCASLVACGGGGGGDPTVSSQSLQALNQVAGGQQTTTSTGSGTSSGSGSAGASTGAPVVTAPVAPPVVPLISAALSVDYSQPVTKTALKSQERVGVNLSGVSDPQGTHEFVDLVMQSRGFGPPTAPWSTTTTVRIDPVTGWPLEDFGMVVFVEQQNTPRLGGTYTIKFKGPTSITLSMLGGTPGTITSRTYDSATGETTILLSYQEGGKNMFLSFTNTQGRLTDLRIIRPGYDANNPPLFTQQYIDHISSFSTLRFMDWMVTNDANVATRWEDRPTPARKRTANQLGMAPGMPWEYAIALANQTASDMWINIPMNADANYIRELARLIKRSLAPNLKVYVEYSNEVWNTSAGFPQSGRMVTAAQTALQSVPKTTRIDFDGNTNQWYLAGRYFTELSMQMSDIFRSEFSAEMMTRIRPVLAWQGAGPGRGSDMLNFINQAYGKIGGDYFYGYAVAPYFNMGDQQAVDGLTVDQVVAALLAKANASPSTYYYEWNTMLARKNNMQLIAYEGGPDTASRVDASLASKAAANRDSRMYDMCRSFLNDWSTGGGQLFVWFHAGAGGWNSRFGSWALNESDIRDTTSPKFRCLTDAANTQAPAFAGRLKVGDVIDTANTADGYSTTSRRWWNTTPALERNYLVGSPTDGCYRMTLNTSFTGTTGPTFTIDVNGTRSLTVGPIATGATAVDINVGTVCLKQGPNAITLKAGTIPSTGQINSFRLSQ